MDDNQNIIQRLGGNIDTAISTKNLQDLNIYQNEALELLNNLKNNNDKGIIHYYIGNVHLFRYDLRSKINDKLQCKKEAINHFLLATALLSDKRYLLPCYTNLANIYIAEHRYLEAIDFCQLSENITNQFLLPIGNKLESLYTITKDFFWEDVKTQRRNFTIYELWRVILISIKSIDIKEYSQEAIEQNKGKQIILSYIKDFEKWFNDYKTFHDEFHKNTSITWNLEEPFLNDEKVYKNNQYHNWCKEERLLLNVLNLVEYTDVYSDNLMLKSLTIEAGDWIYSMWQQICQEYTSARYVFYQYKDTEFWLKYNDKRRKHLSDRRNEITKEDNYALNYVLSNGSIASSGVGTDTNILFAFEIEELKSAYIKTYNIFDKLSVLLFSYIKLLEVSDETCYLKDVQNCTEIKDDRLSIHDFAKLKVDDMKKKNIYLYSFISIYHDLQGNNACDEFKSLKLIRDKITHGYIKISYENYSDFYSYNHKTIQSNYLKINVDSFKIKLKFLLSIIRNSFFYTDLCIAEIEKSIRGGKIN